MVTPAHPDVVSIQQLDIVPRILDVVCRTTGMRFAAVARVTEDKWICCASRDDIAFGLVPGSELDLKTTLCDEIRQHREAIAIPDVSTSSYCNHHTPTMYGFRSYVSVPIIRNDGSFFGTLCAIDPIPASVDTPETMEMFKLFAELIATQLDQTDKLVASEASLLSERTTAELREQFIAVVGHDLRNPLASIIAGLRLLSKATSTADADGIVARMNQSASRMSALIDNVLDFARGRLGDGISLSKSVQHVEPILGLVIEELRLAHPRRSIETHIDCPIPVNCDSQRLAQLASNLLGNALTHGAAEEAVMISATTKGGQFRLAVANAGQPISALAMAQLFKPFSRGAVKKSLQGLGLGLFISSEIARAHHGEISVSSTDEKTNFVFEMPIDVDASP